jgi:hypothetical protein
VPYPKNAMSAGRKTRIPAHAIPKHRVMIRKKSRAVLRKKPIVRKGIHTSLFRYERTHRGVSPVPSTFFYA